MQSTSFGFDRIHCFFFLFLRDALSVLCTNLCKSLSSAHTPSFTLSTLLLLQAISFSWVFFPPFPFLAALLCTLNSNSRSYISYFHHPLSIPCISNSTMISFFLLLILLLQWSAILLCCFTCFSTIFFNYVSSIAQADFNWLLLHACALLLLYCYYFCDFHVNEMENFAGVFN